MNDTYDFSRELRLKILALCLDNSWMKRVGDVIIKPEYFEKDDEEAFVKAILEYRQKFGVSPRDPIDTIHLCNGNNSVFIMDVYEISEENEDLKLAGDVAIQFAKEQAAKLAIIESVDDIQTGNISKAIERMKAALKVGEELIDSGLDPIADIDDWLYEYWESKVRTGWTYVDQVIEGGLTVGELGIILAPTNRGKSMALINIGHGAATIGSSIGVAHFTHEMRPAQVAKRYAARLIFRFPTQDSNLDDYSAEVMIAARKLLTGDIRIFGGKRTTQQIEAQIEQLKADGFPLGLLIDDYLDVIEPPKHYSEKRFELSATYEWYRNLCERHNVPGWSASQSSRASLSKEIITVQDIAEDIGKAQIADVIVALCQTRDEEQMDQCRLFMAKIRDASKKKNLIAAKFYGSSQAIITTGFVVPKKEETDV